ncbi:hypothetical protein DLAC_00108 [Tieghemostelium lacteum]|uniref:Uncharacterized protein n=1 Tax=Tieghemostelium lacteum TaxID=361077 RepID=A0A152A8W4_TIELA|nr:hypothetical protein DLAC_00108 [Tieghemostelium lacteum]|eukprot:KYR02654.1 hypothetical protein DLAC_00108 [Tieghemostelium lacteum]
MSNNFKRKQNKKPLKLGGKVSEEQRKFFEDATKEIQEFATRAIVKKSKATKRQVELDNIKATGRKVKSQYVPIKKANEIRRLKKEKDDADLADAIASGERIKIPKTKNTSDKDNNSKKVSELRIGKFSKGTLHISKSDIKTVKKKK